MLAVTVKLKNFDGVQRSLNQLSGNLRNIATSAALNKTVDKGKTEMIRGITDEYNIKRSDVAARMSVQRAKPGDLMVVLDPFASGHKGRSLNMIHFLDKKVTMREAKRAARSLKGKQGIGRQGVVLFFKVKRGGPSKSLPGAFLGNNGRTVFMRTGKGRLPIEAVSTIGVPQMFNTSKIMQRVMDRINRELPIEADRAVQMVIERYGR